MKAVVKYIGVFSLLIIVVSSCKKYENGGPIASAKKNIQKSWTLERYYVDGVDSLSQMVLTDLVETFNEDGSYTRTYKDSNGVQQSDNGNWELSDGKTIVHLTGLQPYDLTSTLTNITTTGYRILKLKKSLFWYEYNVGGYTHQIHLRAN